MSLSPERPVALVAGSTSGIGEAIARRFLQEGYFVVLHSRSSMERGNALAAELVHTMYIQADLAIDMERTRLVQAAAAVWNRLDVLVNNAAVSRVIPHSDLAAAAPAIWHELYDLNVVAPFRLITEVEPFLCAASQRGTPGCIINISSHAGVRPRGASIPYAASKAALKHMTKLLAVSLAPHIRVNAIAPGLVDTPLTQDWIATQKIWRERSPMRRAATPDDIAQLAMLPTASYYLTGEVLITDGGFNLK